MISGVDYKFKEGTIQGYGQKWHSNYSYLRAVAIGSQ